MVTNFQQSKKGVQHLFPMVKVKNRSFFICQYKCCHLQYKYSYVPTVNIPISVCVVSSLRRLEYQLFTLALVPVKKRLFYLNCVMAFKCMTDLTPSYLTNQFIKRCDVSRRTTRHSKHLNIPLTIQNSLPSDLKSCKSVSHLKKSLHDWLFIPQFLVTLESSFYPKISF